MTVKRLIATALCLVMSVSVVSTGEDAAAKVKKPSIVKKAAVSVGENKVIKIKSGGVKIKSVKWKSDDKKTVTVKKKGKLAATVTGVKAGKAKITATVKTKKSGKTKKATYKLTTKVTVSAPDVEPVEAEGLQPAAPGADKLTKDGYELKWEENFDGSQLNRSDWNVELHEAGWVNQELQQYVDSTDNISVSDGKLHLKPKKTGDKTYTSGRVNTQGKHDFKYGIFEARVKVPKGAGYLPAFWMMPTDENLYGQWPKCGEIDIAEVMGQQTDKLYGTIHYGEPHKETQGTYVTEKDKEDFYAAYHDVAVEWVPGRITWYVDGVKYHEARDWYTAKNGDDPLTFPAPFDQPYYMILNLAVGGSWVGDIDDSTIADMPNQEFAIDYVRAYQKPESEYNEDVIAATGTEDVKLREPDSNGNYIVNGTFSTDEDLVKDEGWAFKTAQNGEGTATIADNKITLKTTKAGDVDYSLQLVQNDLPMIKGASYKLSFEAKASEARKLKVAIQGPDQGWIAYLEQQTAALTTEKQTFTYDFTVTQSTDPNGRLDFNYGALGSTADIEISNVVLVKTADTTVIEKSVTSDGNYVYNGSFDKGDLRLGNWEILEASKDYISVTNEKNTHRLKVVAPDWTSKSKPVIIEQTGLGLLLKGDYLLSYKAYMEGGSNGATPLRISYGSLDFDPQALTDTETVYKQEFKLEDKMARKKANLTIMFTAPGTYFLDDIRMEDNAILKNGSFNSGLSSWSVYINAPADASYTVDSLKEDNAFDITINDTGADSDSDNWYVQLNQDGIKLEKGKKYRVTFRAKCDVERKIQYTFSHNGEKDDNWDTYSGYEQPTLKAEYQTFTKEFTMEKDTDDKARFNITMGSVGGVRIRKPHRICIDDVVLEELS